MIELLDEYYTDAVSYDTILKSVDPGPLYPDHPLTVLIYPIHRRTQRVRKERDKGLLDNSSRRAIWKQFENYKISSGSPFVGRTVIWDKAWGNPPDHVYRTVPAVPTSYGHYWYWTTLSGGPYEPFGEAGKHNATTSINGRVHCPPFLVEQENGSIVAPPSDKNDLCNRALKAMLPVIKEELSLINSVYELKDFRSVPGLLRSLTRAGGYSRLIRQKMGWLNYPLENIKDYKRLKGFLGMTLKRISQQGAGSFLTWKFAVAPLISDIEDIMSSISTYKKSMNSLVNATGGRRKKHFTSSLREFEDTVETKSTGFLQPWVGFNGCVLYEVERDIRYEQSVFHAEIEYNYNYSRYQQQNAATLKLLDDLGLNFSLKHIWDALPWSFVVDWVLRVGDALDRFTIRNMEPQINIHQFLWSIKRKRQILLRARPEAGALTELEAHLDRSWNTLPRVREEVYGRFLDYPVDSALVQASGLSSSEFTIGAALVTAQAGRKRATTRH